MGDERKLILEMLRDGKISSEEAKELLSVLGDNDNDFNTSSEKGNENIHSKEKIEREDNDENWNFFDGLKGLLKGITGPTYEFSEEYTHRFSSYNVKAGIKSKNGVIIIKTWDKEQCSIKVTKKIRGFTSEEKARDFAKSYQVLTLSGDSIETEDYKNKNLSINYEIFLPKNVVLDLTTKSVNGKVVLKNLQLTEGSVTTVNGKINIDGVKGEKIKISGVNGVVDIHSDIRDIICKTVNGKILVKDLNEKEGSVNLSTVNGPIKIELPLGVNGVKVKNSSVNGRLKIEHRDLRVTSQLGKYANKRAEAISDGYIKRTYDLSAVNGVLSVTEIEGK